MLSHGHPWLFLWMICWVPPFYTFICDGYFGCVWKLGGTPPIPMDYQLEPHFPYHLMAIDLYIVCCTCCNYTILYTIFRQTHEWWYSILQYTEYTVTRPPGHWGKNGPMENFSPSNGMMCTFRAARSWGQCVAFGETSGLDVTRLCSILFARNQKNIVFFESSLTRLKQQKHQQWSLGTTPQLDPTGRSSESYPRGLGEGAWWSERWGDSGHSRWTDETLGFLMGIFHQQLTSLKLWWFQMIQVLIFRYLKSKKTWRCFKSSSLSEPRSHDWPYYGCEGRWSRWPLYAGLWIDELRHVPKFAKRINQIQPYNFDILWQLG